MFFFDFTNFYTDNYFMAGKEAQALMSFLFDIKPTITTETTTTTTTIEETETITQRHYNN